MTNHLEIAKVIWEDYYKRDHPSKSIALKNAFALQKCFGINSKIMDKAKLITQEGNEDE